MNEMKYIWLKKKVDILAYDCIFIPFHTTNHWQLYLLQNLRKTIQEIIEFAKEMEIEKIDLNAEDY